MRRNRAHPDGDFLHRQAIDACGGKPVKPMAVVLLLLSQALLVGGQIFLKHGMNLTHQLPRPRGRISVNLCLGIGLLALWFFLWMGLLQKLDLSYVFPFEGLSPVMMVLAAWIILKE